MAFEAGRLAGKVALITGGASGIGEETARQMLAEGARVVLLDLQQERGEKLAAELGEAAHFIQHDVTDEAQWIEHVPEAEAAFGAIHVVMNSAGISTGGPIDMVDYAQWKQTMAINADGVFLGCKYGLEAIRRSEAPGSIINVSSTWGIRGGSLFPVYGASKAAVWMLSKSVALRCAEAGWPIRCNSIHPGAIETPMVTPFLEAGGDPEAARAALGAAHPMNRLGQAGEVASLAVYLASDESSFITGTEIPVDGGFCA